MRKLTLERIVFCTLLLAVFTAVGAVAIQASSYDTSPSDNRKQAVENRNNAFNRAKSLYPDPHNVNFPNRKYLIEWNNREDLIHHPWYVYILG